MGARRVSEGLLAEMRISLAYASGGGTRSGQQRSDERKGIGVGIPCPPRSCVGRRHVVADWAASDRRRRSKSFRRQPPATAPPPRTETKRRYKMLQIATNGENG